MNKLKTLTILLLVAAFCLTVYPFYYWTSHPELTDQALFGEFWKVWLAAIVSVGLTYWSEGDNN